MTNKLITVLALLVVVGGGCVSFNFPSKPADNLPDDKDPGSICKNTCGNGICEEIVCQGTGCPCAETAESCPQDCAAPTENDLSNLIQVEAPVINAKIGSPVTVTGKARGTWYFEASFPVKVYDANNTLLGIGVAQAQSDWMTEDFVDFVATITFSTPSTATGKLVLLKDNPSGLPVNDNSIEIPVTF